MKKNKLMIILLLLLVFPFNNVFTQDTCMGKYDSENLKKGNWAVVFELGSMLWGNDYNYNNTTPQKTESYYFMLKYQTGEKTALRLGINVGGDLGEYYNNGYVNIIDNYNANTVFVGVGLNLQYFITKKYFAKPFISAGPYYCINYSKYNQGKDYTWNLGLDVTFGAEMFIYKSIGIIAEYAARTSLEKNYYKSSGILEYGTDYRWRNSANTSRLGVTFYF